jgi:hypothetical protein
MRPALFAAAAHPERISGVIVGTGGAAIPLQLGEPLKSLVLDPDLEKYRKMDRRAIVDAALNTILGAENHPHTPEPDPVIGGLGASCESVAGCWVPRKPRQREHSGTSRQEAGMRTGAPTDRRGYRHEAVLYDSDEKFLGVVVPFLQEGAALGEPCLVALGASTTGLVRAAVGNRTGLTFLGDRYDRPASVIRSNRELFAAHLTEGASRIRVASEVPHPGVGAPWEGWARYEAVVNRAYAEFPLWACAPTTRASPPAPSSTTSPAPTRTSPLPTAAGSTRAIRTPPRSSPNVHQAGPTRRRPRPHR